jgi:drug/metabolite transporter (DMT)-like permease
MTGRHKKMSWILYSLITMFSLGIMLLLFKKLTTLGVDSIVLNLYIFGMVFLGFVGVSLVTRQPLHISKLVLVLLLVAAVFSIIGNYTNIKAIAQAPNPGYATAIASGRVLVLTLGAVLLFGSDLSPMRVVGVITVLAGLALLSM